MNITALQFQVLPYSSGIPVSHLHSFFSSFFISFLSSFPSLFVSIFPPCPTLEVQLPRLFALVLVRHAYSRPR
jgi:hypothetical protein